MRGSYSRGRVCGVFRVRSYMFAAGKVHDKHSNHVPGDCILVCQDVVADYTYGRGCCCCCWSCCW
jgi:hypothetical protein